MKTLVRKNKAFNPFFDEAFGDLFRSDMREPRFNKTTLPSVNIKEDEVSYSLELAVPGLNKKDIKVELDEDVLTISSETKSENEEKKENYSRREFSYSSFKRSFSLPKDTVDAESIEASCDSGILYVTLPKRKEVLNKGPKLFEVK